MIGPVQGPTATSQAYQAQTSTQPPSSSSAKPSGTPKAAVQDQVSISENARQAAADNATAPGGSLVDRDHDGH
jgi:hypothetical protein